MTNEEYAVAFIKESAFDTIDEIIGNPYEYIADDDDSKLLCWQNLTAVYGIVTHVKTMLKDLTAEPWKGEKGADK